MGTPTQSLVSCEELRDQSLSIRMVRGLFVMECLRARIAEVGKDIESDASTLLRGGEPQAYAHPFEE